MIFSHFCSTVKTRQPKNSVSKRLVDLSVENHVQSFRWPEKEFPVFAKLILQRQSFYHILFKQTARPKHTYASNAKIDFKSGRKAAARLAD